MNSPTLDIQQRIEEGALRLFSQYGYIGTSMRMVAKEAYASLGSIYYYYEDWSSSPVQAPIWITTRIDSIS